MNNHLLDHGLGITISKTELFTAISKPVRAGSQYAAHYHDTSSLSVLLCGRARETRSRVHKIEREVGIIVCNPAGETHDLCFADQMAHSIVIEIDTMALSRTTDLACVFDQANVWRNQLTAIWGLKLHAALLAEESMAVEDAVFEIVAPVLDRPKHAMPPPTWLKRAKEFLRETPDDCKTIASLALSAGVDAAHFAREFRRYFGLTASEYRMLSRLDQGCRALLNANATPSEAAYLSGFSDQSHFGRALKRYAKLTPLAAKTILQISMPRHQSCSSH
jgi:AraC family transcriptional regulator